MTNIYVGNLPYAVNEDDLIEFFKQWGDVDRATLVFDRETGRPRGFGFVEMEDPAAAAQAIAEAHGREFHGRPLTVNEARPRGSGRTGTTSSHPTPSTSHPGSAAGYGNGPTSNGNPGSTPPPASNPSPSQSSGGGYSNQIYQ
ncbi:MAG: RNA-binding protein [Planctomycetota bacterium]